MLYSGFGTALLPCPLYSCHGWSSSLQGLALEDVRAVEPLPPTSLPALLPLEAHPGRDLCPAAVSKGFLPKLPSGKAALMLKRNSGEGPSLGVGSHKSLSHEEGSEQGHLQASFLAQLQASSA